MSDYIKLVFILLLHGSISASIDTVRIRGDSYDFTIIKPENLEIVSNDSLVKRTGAELVLLNMRCSVENSSVSNDKILYSFMTSTAPLAHLDFTDISNDVRSGYVENELIQISDTMSVLAKEFKEVTDEKYFFIKGNILLVEETKSYNQLIIPTNFGYIIVMHIYSNDGLSCISPSEIIKNVKVKEDFIYRDSAKRRSWTPLKMGSVLLVGLSTFFLLELITKLLRSKNAKG